MCTDCKTTLLVPKGWWVAVAVHGVHKVRETDAIEGGDESVQRVGVAEVDIGRTDTAIGRVKRDARDVTGVVVMIFL